MADHDFSVEVIITAYNQAEYTRLVLEAYSRQSDPDFTVAVADDGSGPEIAELVKSFQARGLPVRHVWHEDRGYRRAEILNKAIAGSHADYLIFTDNDCMPQLEFIADHKRRAEKGYFVVGRRVNLNSTLSERFVKGKYDVSRINSRLWLLMKSLCGHLRYAEVGMRIPWWLCEKLSRGEAHLLGANVGAWREELLSVNGYDNDFVGYGMEDTDLEWRLKASGVRSRTIKGRGGVIHLYHPERSKTEKNAELMKARQAEGLVKVRNGIIPSEPSH